MKQFLPLCLLLATAYAARIESVNFEDIAERVNSLNTTWKADPNFPSNLPVSSIQWLFGAKESDATLPELDESEFDTNDVIPEEFDARKKWPECPTISDIPNQSKCGSCWAVAAASAFSDRLCIASKGKFKSALSANELLSCCTDCGYGCDGGFPVEAWEYFKEVGIVTGGGYNSSIGCQPYPFPRCGSSSDPLPPCSTLPDYKTPECQEKCTNPEYSAEYKQDHHKIKKTYSLRNIELIQRDIMKNGPVEASFTAYQDFMTYKSGVYHHTVTKVAAGHAVRIIGWGTDNGTPYWLVANSWDKYWGEEGLFRILRGSNESGIEGSIVAGIPDV
uniref:Cathepsin B n=1 Tax=Riptortus pedestris TaxID=329032 RepID=R4WR66_RIPPE|nr:cathepsin B [Riptortus pedestris]